MATRILIADDHDMMRTVLRNLINSHDGWQVCAEAKNGSEAVAWAKELHPDLIILDLAMPVMDGLRAAREITRTDPSARMIMFTLHASPEVEEQAKRAGVKRVVSKAKNGGRLLTAIEQALGGGNEETHFDENRTVEDLKEKDAGTAAEIRVHQTSARNDDGDRTAPVKARGASANASRTSARNSTDGSGGTIRPGAGPFPHNK